MSQEFVWTVDGYSDRVTQRREKDWLKRLAQYPHHKEKAFESANEAHAYIQDRAVRLVADFEHSLKLAKQRVAKCRRKFPVVLPLAPEPTPLPDKAAE